MSIKRVARSMGITRLCHFTPASNFGHMLVSGAIEGTAELIAAKAAFRQNDKWRFDGRTSDVCCSIEYPNTWYLDIVRESELNYLDWIVLTLPLSLLDTPGAGFCPFNAARGHGEFVEVGEQAFRALFAPTVTGQRTFRRTGNHPSWWPTDDQAEVRVPGPIPASMVTAAIFASDEQAERERARHELLQPLHPLPTLIVAPDLFHKRRLSDMVRIGRRPPERLLS